MLTVTLKCFSVPFSETAPAVCPCCHLPTSLLPLSTPCPPPLTCLLCLHPVTLINPFICTFLPQQLFHCPNLLRAARPDPPCWASTAPHKAKRSNSVKTQNVGSLSVQVITQLQCRSLSTCTAGHYLTAMQVTIRLQCKSLSGCNPGDCQVAMQDTISCNASHYCVAMQVTIRLQCSPVQRASSQNPMSASWGPTGAKSAAPTARKWWRAATCTSLQAQFTMTTAAWGTPFYSRRRR